MASEVNARVLSDFLNYLRIEKGLAPLSIRSEEHTSELQSQSNLVCRLLLEKKKKHNSSGCICNRTLLNIKLRKCSSMIITIMMSYVSFKMSNKSYSVKIICSNDRLDKKSITTLRIIRRSAINTNSNRIQKLIINFTNTIIKLHFNNSFTRLNNNSRFNTNVNLIFFFFFFFLMIRPPPSSPLFPTPPLSRSPPGPRVLSPLAWVLAEGSPVLAGVPSSFSPPGGGGRALDAAFFSSRTMLGEPLYRG